MANYSNSKISTFEVCPYQYKLKYVDRVEVDVPTIIESFMGDLVHRALEKLHKNALKENILSKEEVISYFKEIWSREYTPEILIVKNNLTEKDYYNLGIKFLENYYDQYYPFNQIKILGLETEDKLSLENGSKWHVRIDKLGTDENGNYYVCDYKTSSKMKTQGEAESDRQLAMYSLWVKENFKDAKEIYLVWHMLAFNESVATIAREENLKKIKLEVLEKIKDIETAEKENNFPTCVSALCNYCVYKGICPEWNKKDKD